jgi:hypothetical protein
LGVTGWSREPKTPGQLALLGGVVILLGFGFSPDNKIGAGILGGVVLFVALIWWRGERQKH